MFVKLEDFFSAKECREWISWAEQRQPDRITAIGEHMTRQHYTVESPQLEQAVEEIVQRIVQRPIWWNGAGQLFEDPPGWIIEEHRDTSPNMCVNFQVYLTGGVPTLGTVARINGAQVLAEYAPGSGYVLVDPHKISHGMIKPVPPGHVRWSYYASWRFTEQAEEIW